MLSLASRPPNNLMPRSDIFIDPNTRQVLRIYLDTTHIKDHVFNALRHAIEGGGGHVASNKEDASIWIVDPEAPYALGEWKDSVTAVLFAPWLLACVANGALLGAEEGNWCGFKVTPQVRSKIVPKQIQKKGTKLQLDRWPSHLKNSVLRIPVHSLPSVEAVPLDAAPAPPPEEEWGIPWSNGKRPMSVPERVWISETIEWCMAEYPMMNIAAMCEIMSMLGWHRKKESYQVWILRNLDEVAERTHCFMDFLVKIQSENESELCHSNPQLSTPISSQLSRTPLSESQSTPNTTPGPKPAKAPKPGWYYEVLESPEVEDSSWSSARTPFTDQDRLSFIRYAAARPTGMEPGPGENAVDVWKTFVAQHPSHSHQSWRAWHQHRRAELKAEVERYRAMHLS